MSIKLLSTALKENAGAILRWAVVALLAYAISFGDGRYARPAQIEAAEVRLHATDLEIAARFAPLEVLPNRIQNLETWQAEQKLAQQFDAAQFSALKVQLSTIEAQLAVLTALQREQAKNTDRVLSKLDSLK